MSRGGVSGGGVNGGGVNGGGVNGGGSGGMTGVADMAAVQAIFTDRCVTCHDASRTDALPLFPKLSLVARDAYTALVNKAATEVCGGTLVVPGNPDQSYLIRKLNDQTPCDGLHMPRAFEILPAPAVDDRAARHDTLMDHGRRNAE